MSKELPAFVLKLTQTKDQPGANGRLVTRASSPWRQPGRAHRYAAAVQVRVTGEVAGASPGAASECV